MYAIMPEKRMLLIILYDSLCPDRPYLLSEARCSTWLLEEPIRRCQMGTGLSFALFIELYALLISST